MSATQSWFTSLNTKMLRQIGMHQKAVLGIRGGHELPAPHRQQVILLHHTAHFLRPHCKSLPLHQYGYPAVSVKAVRHSYTLDGIAQRHLSFRGSFFLPVPIE